MRYSFRPKCSEETKRKIGLANSLKKRTEAEKERLRHLRLGTKATEETKAKMRQNASRYWLGKKRPSMTGKNNPNFGKFGKNHPHWKENKKSSLQKSIRQCYKYNQWKSKILKRDSFSCVLCGINNVYLEIDHYPKGFSKILEEHNIQTLEDALSCKELWRIKNGRTLCPFCHEKTADFPRQLVGKRKIVTTQIDNFGKHYNLPLRFRASIAGSAG